MQIKATNLTKTSLELVVNATEVELTPIKSQVLSHLKDSVKVPGFRAGHVPSEIVEKNIDPNVLQSEFLEHAIEQLYFSAAQTKALRPVSQPKISLTKFVPYSELEFKATIDVIGDIKLPDYKKIKLVKTPINITAKDINEVIKSLQTRLADKSDVDRVAKNGDQVWIDFKGIDDKGLPVQGADGKDYPLQLGSGNFIPGFEDNLIGLKANDEKTFELTFPKDYGVKALANRKVTFNVTVSKVQEVSIPKVDDSFAAKAGPFKTLTELKADIKKQLKHERQHEADRNYESELVKKISDKSTVDIPEALIEENIERLMQDLRQNLTYRGMTIQEYLDAEGMTEDEYKTKVVKPQASERVKASLVLSEIAEREKLDVTAEELEVRMQILKGQYKDQAMQAELDKPEARRDIASRILTEKTLEKLTSYNNTK